jgi:hypothetical protein
MTDRDRKAGSCLCGEVAFEVDGALRPVIGCHCHQCRKQTGHFLAATGAKLAHFTLTSDASLKWYRASDTARRGFCGACGSTLFWQRDGADYIAIAAGAIDEPTGLRLMGHIFCADKGDYYEITDGDFQLPEGGLTVPVPD